LVNGFRRLSYIFVFFVVKSAARGNDRRRRVALLFICRKSARARWRGMLLKDKNIPHLEGGILGYRKSV
jgi:hypothetical protein